MIPFHDNYNIIITVPDVCCFQASWSSWLSLKLQRSSPARWGPGAHSDSPHKIERNGMGVVKGHGLDHNWHVGHLQSPGGVIATELNRNPKRTSDVQQSSTISQKPTSISSMTRLLGWLIVAAAHPVLYYFSRLIQLLLKPCSDMNTLMIEMQDALMYAHHSNILQFFSREWIRSRGFLPRRSKELLPFCNCSLCSELHSLKLVIQLLRACLGMRWQSANGVWQFHANALTKRRSCASFLFSFHLLCIYSDRYWMILAQGKISIVPGHSGEKQPKTIGKIFPSFLILLFAC